MTASGGLSAAARAASSAGRRRLDLVAGAAQVRLRAPAGSAARRRRPGFAGPSRAALGVRRRHRERERRSASAAGSPLGPEPAAVRLREPARDREPEARCRGSRRRRPRSKGSKMRSSSRSVRSRAVVDDADDHLVAAGSPVTRRPARPQARTCSAFSSRLASTRSIWAASTRTGGGRPAASTATRSRLVARARRAPAPTSSSTVQSSGCGVAAPASSRDRSRRFADEPVEPPRLDADRLHELRAVLGVQLDAGSRGLGGGADRRQRRAQIVADRAEDCGLDRRRCGAAPRPRAPRRRAARGRPRPRAARREPGGTAAATVRSASRSSTVKAARRAGRPPSGSKALGGLGRAARAELDPCARDAEDVRRLGGDAAELVARARSPSSSAARPAPAAPPRAPAARPPPRAGARAGRELADDDRGDEVDGERDPVLGVAQRERVRRRQEEPVEGQHARDRDRRSRSAFPRRRRPAARRRRRARRG